MKRRRFLQLFGGVSLAGLPGLRLAGQRRRIGVIGGGIIGASIGYHLAHRGAEVTLFERERPGSGATGNSFAWINAGYSKRPWEYFYLNRLGMEAYRYLDQQLGGALQVQWGGSLQWHADAERAQRLRGNVRTHQKWGYPVHLVSETQFANLAPNIAPGPVLAAAHAEQEAAIDPVHVTEALLTEAEKAGLTIEVPCEVNGLDIQWGRLRGVTTSKGPIELDTLVIAAGVDTPRLAEKAGIKVPLRDSPGILAHTTPQPRLLERLAVALAPAGHLKQKPDGRVVTGLTFDGTPGLEPTREQGERQLQTAAQYVPQLKAAELERVTLGWRVMPQDGYPIVGFPEGAPDIYIAAMHSGVTMGALMGRLVAHEILDAVRVEMLEPFRLSRFDA